ncbi:transglycosylase family protein [Streptomyces sp. NPDC050738]|uniref:transglycosylase family protein n=1 Tax=Streptomyces sp. NPDC050738 TaxID=3154744 RepID=UPI0034322F01
MLFSSKSKHRRPSKAVRYTMLAGITGAAVAAPLIGATSASAASVSTWDAVAQCESGGDWSINTGNGYYGGLQFSDSSWAAAGGTQYAQHANEATKDQQIATAEKLLDMQGPGAWACAGAGNLSNDGVDPGVSTDSGNSASSDSSSSDSSSSSSDNSYSADSSSSSDSSSSDDSAQAPAAETPAPKASSSSSYEKGDGEYKVKTGDTLSKIAESHDTTWQKLFKANGDIVKNADLIYPGQQLHLS